MRSLLEENAAQMLEQFRVELTIIPLLPIRSHLSVHRVRLLPDTNVSVLLVLCILCFSTLFTTSAQHSRLDTFPEDDAMLDSKVRVKVHGPIDVRLLNSMLQKVLHVRAEGILLRLKAQVRFPMRS